MSKKNRVVAVGLTFLAASFVVGAGESAADPLPVFTTIAINPVDDSCVPVSSDYATCAEACTAAPQGCAEDIHAHINSDAFRSRRILYPDLPPGKVPRKKPNIQTPMHGLFVSIYVNEAANQALKSSIASPEQVPDLPPWSIVAKYNFPPVTKRGNPELAPWETHMYKIPGYCPERATAFAGPCVGGEWFYLLYRGGFPSFEWDIANGSIPAIGKAEDFCIECHGAVSETDWLWVIHDILDRERQLAQPVRFDFELPGTTSLAGQCNNVGRLNPNLPFDVKTDPSTTEDAQRMFACFAWRSFVALNWPSDPDSRGRPDRNASIGDALDRNRVWETYRQTYEIFQKDDPFWTLEDTPFGRPQRLPEVCEDALAADPTLSGQPRPLAFQVLNERHQAFGNQFNTIVDQNGNQLRFNIRVDKTEYDFIRNNNLAATGRYGYNGPIAFAENQDRQFSFPDNQTQGYGNGATEIKSAWKELCTDAGSCNPIDDPDRYYSRLAFLYNPPVEKSEGTVPESCRVAEVGLVGLHVVRKTFWAPQWIWATFEHVDNVPDFGEEVDPNISPNPYSLFDPQCLINPPTANQCLRQRPGVFGRGSRLTCCQNQQLITNSVPDPVNDAPFDDLVFPKLLPNQVTRVNDITDAAKALNPVFQGLLADAGSPFQYYQLVATQWPLNGRLGGDGVVPYAVVNKMCREGDTGACFTIEPRDVPGNGGRRVRNTTMETYQVSYCEPEDQDIGNDPANCTPDLVKKDPHQFSSAGCINCHFSSGTDSSFIWLDAILAPVPLPQN